MKIKIILIILLLAGSVVPVWAQEPPIKCSTKHVCTFSWKGNPESDMKEYRLYYGSTAGVYDGDSSPLVVVHPNTSIEVMPSLELSKGLYYFALGAVNTSDQESGLTSPDVIIDVLAPPPQTPQGFGVTIVPIPTDP